MSANYDSIAHLYDHYVTSGADIPFFIEESRRVRGAVLELMAGTGRLSVPLLEAGLQLTCVDNSRRMLDQLSRKLRQRGLRADVRCMDVCRIDLQNRFALAVLPFQSFMEIIGEVSQMSVLSGVSGCLSSGGRFICTLHNPAVRRVTVDGSMRIVGRFPVEGGTLVVSGFEWGGQPVVHRHQFFELIGADGHTAWKQLFEMEFAFIERDDFARMAQEAGFRVARLYGNYDRSAFDPARSPFMIWVLQKNDVPAVPER